MVFIVSYLQNKTGDPSVLQPPWQKLIFTPLHPLEKICP